MIVVRPATLEDRAAIAAFTTDTFTWGDYVAEAFERWIQDPDGTVLVFGGAGADPPVLAFDPVTRTFTRIGSTSLRNASMSTSHDTMPVIHR